MLTADNFHESFQPRMTQKPEFGYGSIVPRKDDPISSFSTTMKDSYTKLDPAEGQQDRCGFMYDGRTKNVTAFDKVDTEACDPWGRSKADKAGHFGEHHICSTTRMFNDCRGHGEDRLGITIPGDDKGPVLPFPEPKAAAEDEGPKSFGRTAVIARAPADWLKVGGSRVYFDDK